MSSRSWSWFGQADLEDGTGRLAYRQGRGVAGVARWRGGWCVRRRIDLGLVGVLAEVALDERDQRLQVFEDGGVARGGVLDPTVQVTTLARPDSDDERVVATRRRAHASSRSARLHESSLREP